MLRPASRRLPSVVILRALLVLSPIGAVLALAGCMVYPPGTRNPFGPGTPFFPGNGMYQQYQATVPAELVVGSEAAEKYAHVADSRFQDARQHPLSTFSIDVDTASYSNVRRFLLTEHRLPPADAVRIEELINYFPYAYSAPEGEHPVACTLDLGECPWNSKHHLVRIGLAAARLDPHKMPPRNLVFLVDTSGSMNAPNRLPLLKKSLLMLVDQLGEQDRVALVSYAGSAGLVLPSTPGSQKRTIRQAIHHLEAGGATNGGEGIVLAYQVAQDNFLPYGLNRVILGTDGDFNLGLTGPDELVRLIEKKRRSGVYLSLLGFGMGNLKDATLEKLAHHGNGHYAYIDSEAEARKVFVEQGAALVTVARDVKLQVEFNPQRVRKYRLLGYENRQLAAKDFNNDRKDAGDMGAGHTVTALYEIDPARPMETSPKVDRLKYQPATAGSEEWLTVKLRYKSPGTEKSRLLAQALSGPVQELSEMPADFRFASAVAGFGLLLRGSGKHGELTYEQVHELAEKALGKDPGGHRAAFLEMIDAARSLAGSAARAD